MAVNRAALLDDVIVENPTTVPVADADRFGHSVSVAYPLTFSTDFFWNENADSTKPRTHEKRPSSVEQALTQISNETWERLARDVFDCEPEHLNIEAVLQKIEETNTCLNLDSPVEVLIDPDGEFTVLVYDRDKP